MHLVVIMLDVIVVAFVVAVVIIIAIINPKYNGNYYLYGLSMFYSLQIRCQPATPTARASTPSAWLPF